MKIKIVRKGRYDWVSDMDEFIGEIHEATMRYGKEKDEDGNMLDVFDIIDESSDADAWTWYSDAVEIVEEYYE